VPSGPREICGFMKRRPANLADVETRLVEFGHSFCPGQSTEALTFHRWALTYGYARKLARLLPACSP